MDQEGQKRARKILIGYWLPICECRHVTIAHTECADLPASDGPTPDAKSQQILSVAPILPGQTSQSLNGAHRSQSYHTQTSQGTNSNDLIDFGQASDSSGARSGQAPPQQSKTRDLLDLQDQPGPGQPVQRVDTMTSDLDEFVDAKP